MAAAAFAKYGVTAWRKRGAENDDAAAAIVAIMA